MRWNGYLRAALIGGMALALGSTGANATEANLGGQPTKRTIALALYYASFAMYETADAKEECPQGFHLSNQDNWKLQYPTEEAQKAFIEARVHLGPRGYAAGNYPKDFLQARGPQGQSVAVNPKLFNDAPLREVQSKVAYGLNLDGTSDGRATPNTCKHEKFASADGKSVAVDNQLYRVYGCTPGWRKGGAIADRRITEVRAQPLNRLLFEITDVDDERNDSDVTVTIYKGIDRIELDPAGNPILNSQQRIDVRFTKYTTRTRGKIVDGVLTTDPIDQYMPMLNIQEVSERLVRGMRLQLKLNPTGAEGYLAGYENLKAWWNSYTKSYSRHTDGPSPWSPPAMYEAAYRLADGYPDPQTGQCTAISAAYDVKMVRANLVTPRPDDPLVTNAAFKAAQHTAFTPHAVKASSERIDPDALLARVQTPPGIDKRMTYFGPAFTDKQGMTLYVHTSEWPCIAARRTLPNDAPPLLKIYAKYTAAPFCTDQWPPLMASAEDKSVGDWTIIERPAPDVGKQWAYKGRPVHRSNRDLLPGDVNGPTGADLQFFKSGFMVAGAPLLAPPGLRPIYLRPYGVVATTENGPVYTLSKPAKSPLKSVSLNCADCVDSSRWKPFPAGALAKNMGPWTIAKLPDGSKVWAYDGDVLYTYAFDQSARNSKGLGVDDRASLVTLKTFPMAPRGFTVQYTLLGPTYADARGMSAYQFHCIAAQPGETRMADVSPNYYCDGLGVDTMHREMFCTAPDKCGERWRPVEAPVNAEPQGGMWSVAVIADKRYSLRWEQAKPGEKLAPGAVKVWTYRGRPIFTSAEDDNPTDLRGHDVNLRLSPIWWAIRAGEPEERGIAAGN